MKRRNTYLAIAITTKCNYQCFYCKEGGESISKKQETIPFSKLKKVIISAYETGIKNFRITGGEPTCVDYFNELIEFIMNFDETKIRINTNGYEILKYINILEKYKERLDVIFSVDSISNYLNDACFQKFLSSRVMYVTNQLKERNISVRYNVVVTTLNECEVKKLVLKATDELHVNVKLLDLNRFSEYLGSDGKVVGQEAYDLWKKLFVPISNFYDFLEEISAQHNSKWTTGFNSCNNGIPMGVYFRNENFIQVKDSTRGASYSAFCMNKCNYYKCKNCREGVFSLFLSSNIIHAKPLFSAKSAPFPDPSMKIIVDAASASADDFAITVELFKSVFAG